MNKWKITQIFINLPPQKQIVAGLFFTVLVLGAVVSGVVVHYEIIITAKDKEHSKIIKSKDSLYVVSQNRNIDFMEREINRRYKFIEELDSLKKNKKDKK